MDKGKAQDWFEFEDFAINNEKLWFEVGLFFFFSFHSSPFVVGVNITGGGGFVK